MKQATKEKKKKDNKKNKTTRKLVNGCGKCEVSERGGYRVEGRREKG